MFFTDDEIQEICNIFKRLETSTLDSIQVYDHDDEFRTGCTYTIKTNFNKTVCIFQNFNNLTAYRLKLLNKLKSKIKYPMHVTYTSDGIIRVGWKSINN